MTEKVSLQEAQKIINGLCAAAEAGAYPTREAFMEAVADHPHLAVQGYNAFGKIFFWNDASAYLYNYSESDAINQDLFELVLPEDMRLFARDAVMAAARTGCMPEPGPCDLMRKNNEFVTVYSGHIVFQWDDNSSPEFYCLDLALNSDAP